MVRPAAETQPAPLLFPRPRLVERLAHKLLESLGIDILSS